MKTLYVTIPEWLDVLAAVERWRGNWGGFKPPTEATVSAIGEILGPDVAAWCAGGVRVEIVTDMAPYGRFGNAGVIDTAYE